MLKIRKIGGAFCKVYEAVQKWREIQKARGIAGLLNGMLMFFAFGTGVLCSTSSLTIAQAFPPYARFVNLWSVEPMRIRAAVL